MGRSEGSETLAPEEAEGLVAAGARALEAGDWTTAEGSFRAALDLGVSAEALAGFGDALWWLGRTRHAFRAGCRHDRHPIA